MSAVYDLKGKKFGRWLVLERSKRRCRVSTQALWDCICDCGQRRAIASDSLRRGRSRSCGCLCIDENKIRNTLPPGEATRRAVLATYKRSAKKRGLRWDITEEHFDLLFSGACFYCTAEPPNGIDRIDNSEGYIETNVRSCCKICNYAKNTMSEEDFKNWIAQVYKNFQTRGKT